VGPDGLSNSLNDFVCPSVLVLGVPSWSLNQLVVEQFTRAWTADLPEWNIYPATFWRIRKMEHSWQEESIRLTWIKNQFHSPLTL